MSHLSFEGQSEVDYCIECAVKHIQTGKVFMREGLQRAEVNGPQSEGVKEKVRGVVEELSGIEADTDTVKNAKVTAINTAARELRKRIYSSQAEIGGASIETLQEIKAEVDTLVEQIYKVREEEEECPTCQVPAETKEEPEQDIESYGVSVAEKRKKFIEEIRTESPG